ncbi:unnamed protein product [Triticum turgidum subsp. durum]|uniref:Disease resistance N-terminal domain-containing protein n=1 Tax=Triticum turgidum subsp. durum TaxID=4567 RepID=A0A9R0YAS5_TRITD|nr:unnamed protein product [Triticum turgidum subsp. durum]
MQTAIGAARWLLGKALEKLSDELVATFVASSELGDNFQTIKRRLMLTQGLLYAAQDRDLSDNPGLYGLLEELSKKADEAEDVLDEIHYFMIQHQLDGTSEAAPQMGDVIRGHVRHVCHAFRHNIGSPSRGSILGYSSTF